MATGRGLFVVGTDTGVGKTVVSAALLARLRPVAPIRYWKPVQTGIEEDDDTWTVVTLSGCGVGAVVDEGVRLLRPLSPHLSARLSGTTIDTEALLAIAVREQARTPLLIEGAGGLLVPLNDHDLLVALVQKIDVPVVIAARSGLGTINHTLLTLEALRMRSIWIAGVVMVGEPNAENRLAIERYGRVPVIGELPWLDPLTPVALQRAAARLDPDGSLHESIGVVVE